MVCWTPGGKWSLLNTVAGGTRRRARSVTSWGGGQKQPINLQKAETRHMVLHRSGVETKKRGCEHRGIKRREGCGPTSWTRGTGSGEKRRHCYAFLEILKEERAKEN